MNPSLKLACLVVVFAACLCQSDAFVIPQNETEGGPCREFVNENILDITEELRDRMHLPLPRFNVPALHPLFVEHISLENYELLAGLDIQLHNLSFIGFRDFQINNLTFNLVGFNISLQLVIPSLEISGHHVPNGSLYGLVSVIGQGPVNLTVSDLVFDINGRFNHTGLEWEVPETNMNFTITGISGGFSNLTNNFFNDLLNLSGAEILELAWPGLQPTVEDTVGWDATEFLNGFTMEELMGFLFGASLDWSDVDDQTSSVATTSAPTSALPFY